jgi:hypothetical protein
MTDATATLPHIMVNNADAFVALLQQHGGIVHQGRSRLQPQRPRFAWEFSVFCTTDGPVD